MIEPQTPPEPYKITSEYLDYLIGILTGTVTPKAAAEFIPVLEIAQMAQLGAAWAEAEAAAEERGVRVLSLELTLSQTWAACAAKGIDAPGAEPPIFYVSGPTPVAALRALAEGCRLTT